MAADSDYYANNYYTSFDQGPKKRGPCVGLCTPGKISPGGPHCMKSEQ